MLCYSSLALSLPFVLAVGTRFCLDLQVDFFKGRLALRHTRFFPVLNGFPVIFVEAIRARVVVDTKLIDRRIQPER
jgi:hypothetical protein